MDSSDPVIRETKISKHTQAFQKRALTKDILTLLKSPEIPAEDDSSDESDLNWFTVVGSRDLFQLIVFVSIDAIDISLSQFIKINVLRRTKLKYPKKK